MVYLLWSTSLEENNLYFTWCVFLVPMFCLSVNFLIVTRYLHSTAVHHSCHEVLNWCFFGTVIDLGQQTQRVLMCGLDNDRPIGFEVEQWEFVFRIWQLRGYSLTLGTGYARTSVDFSFPPEKEVARRHDTRFLESDKTYLCRVWVGLLNRIAQSV